jgi:hypothetical protein
MLDVEDKATVASEYQLVLRQTIPQLYIAGRSHNTSVSRLCCRR